MTQIEVKSYNEIKQLRQNEHFNRDYIIIKKNLTSKKDDKSPGETEANCCELKGTSECICDHVVYQVRPYTYDILRGI